MTVSSALARWQFAGNSVATVFAVGKVFADTDLVVVLVNNSTGVETTQVLTTHYTVQRLPTSSTVTFGSAPVSGNTVVIRRVLTETQLTSIRNQGAFFPEIHEDALDKLTMLVQQASDLISRALRRPDVIGSNFDAGGLLIQDVGTAVDPGDAVNLLQAQSLAVAGVSLLTPGMVQQAPAIQSVTGTQDNLPLSNLTTQDVILLRATGATTINGIMGPTTGQVRRFTLVNASLTSHDITLTHDSGSPGLPDRRLVVLSGASLVLAPGRSCTLTWVQAWDGAPGVNRWVVGHAA